MRLETHRPDLSHELPTSLLEEAIKRCWIGGIGYWSDGTGRYRPEGLDMKREST